MDIKTYQEWTRSTAIYPKNASIQYTALGLTGEAGEVANVAKKILRDDNGELTEAKRQKLIDEIGDVMWYVARLSDELGVNLEDVLSRNVEKLESRKERNALQGSGDNR